MTQREHLEELQPGDFIQLPAGEWHTNHRAKTMFADAQQRMRDAQGSDNPPQYEVENEPGPGFKSKLKRIR